ncbi:DUF6624 domain-containing protein [Chryseobacterium sp. ISL-6]|uniref:DUF6624 domain-containing protein n=1 Tax=Chryseobacterium sp. ISL-6 TaxID=2819143 RepID=UPI001BE5163D|nr:DUF6624 domain-containing protein [Chryseobacterium sp. ISL-6]MBT2622548.1 hypothetical protein [Chryseobacterium sp. ISL-6]
MDYKIFAQKIILLKDVDLEFRNQLIQKGQFGEGYNEEMEKLHNKNAEILNDIVDSIGYPTIDKVGKEASEAAWLIIQHSIGKPVFMKKCAELLKKAVDENKADPKNLAYLTDRIAVFEGKPQLYGTQFDWNENGELVPNSFDDLIKVNQRRKLIGLNTLEDQIVLIQHRVKNENQTPPKDFNQRKNDSDEWKKKVGWIK